MATKHGNLEQIPPESHHEVSDVSARPIFYFAIALVILIILTLISMKGLFNFLDQDADRSDTPAFRGCVRASQTAPLTSFGDRSGCCAKAILPK